MTTPQQVTADAREALQETNLCQQARQFVPYRGSDNPRIVFIGEAPGKHEDIEGEPFVGQAGDLLDTWIEGLGLDEDEYAITNLVKCRPPENRAPNGEETSRFGPWLEKELEAFDPDILVPLGASATRYLLPDTTDKGFLKEICYQEHDHDHGRVIPLPHPAYGLRQGRMDLDYERLKEQFRGEK